MSQEGNQGPFPLDMQRRMAQRFIRRHKNPVAYNAVVATVPAGKSVLDVGSGWGHYVVPLAEAGYRARGIDGTPGIAELPESRGLIDEVDLESDDCRRFFGRWDWALFLEVGEHIPRRHEQSLIDKVASIPTEGLIVTWAPGSKGHGHVNCRTDVWVAQQFIRRGWEVNEEATERFRGMCGRKCLHAIVLKRFPATVTVVGPPAVSV